MSTSQRFVCGTLLFSSIYILVARGIIWWQGQRLSAKRTFSIPWDSYEEEKQTEDEEMEETDEETNTEEAESGGSKELY